MYQNAGLPCTYVPQEGEYIMSSNDPYYPFANEEEFNFAEVVTTKGLAGSVIVSRTWRDRLLGAGAGATLTLVALWLVLISAAAAAVILRA